MPDIQRDVSLGQVTYWQFLAHRADLKGDFCLLIESQQTVPCSKRDKTQTRRQTCSMASDIDKANDSEVVDMRFQSIPSATHPAQVNQDRETHIAKMCQH